MTPILRVARATNDLAKIAAMYREGLDLRELARFEAHDGFDGVILGHEKAPYHLEFTREHGVFAPRSPSAEDLLIFYVGGEEAWRDSCARMVEAGFEEKAAHNPYWDKAGRTFEDPEGYRVVLTREVWRL